MLAGSGPELSALQHGAGRAEDSATPRAIAAAARATFGGLTRIRGARVVHPHGVGYLGRLRIERPVGGHPGVPLLEEPREHRVLFRFSRGGGLPEPLPDVLGVALRLPDVHGRGRHQDFLLASSVDAPLLHHLLLPGPRGFLRHSFSSILPYRVGRNLRLVGAKPVGRPTHQGGGTIPELVAVADRGALRFRLALAALGGRWRAIGDLLVDERLSDEDTDRLAFTPWNSGGGIRPVGPLMGLRRAAYRGSQAQRGLSESEIP